MNKQTVYINGYNSPIGYYTLASDGKYLLGVWLEGQKYFCSSLINKHILKKDLEIFSLTTDWLERYFLKKRPAISELPLAPVGSNFRQDVWRLLCQIPYRTYTTYGNIALKIAKDYGKINMSAQAIGNAIGHNPISIIIPCHRVVSVNGSLTGYAGGIKTKLKLLEHENTDVSKLFIPR